MRLAVALAVLTLSTLVAERSRSADWELAGMSGISCTSLTYDPWHERLLVGTIEGFHVYDFATHTWAEHDEEDWIGRHVGAIIGHQMRPSRVITGRVNAFFKGYVETSDSLDENGDYFHPIDGGLVTGLARDGFDRDRYYACSLPDVSPGEFLRSLDGGETWTTLFGTGQFGMTSVMVDQANSVYLSGDAPISRSTDGGASWTSWSTGLPGAVTNFVAAWQPAPLPPLGGDTSIYTGSSAGTFMRRTDESEWSQVSTLPGRNMWVGEESITARGILQPSVLVTTSGTVAFSSFAPAGFHDETGNLAGLDVLDATVVGDSVYVATRTSGVFRTRFVPGTIDVPPGVSSPSALLAVSPHPVRGAATVTLELVHGGHARLEVFDVSGRRLDVLVDRRLSPGRHRVAWDGAGGPAGVRYLRLVTPDGTGLHRVVTR